MADHKDCLSAIFDDLDANEFGKFQWQLRNEGVVKKAKLDNANREQTIDAMVQTYEGDKVLEITNRILKKIQRNDLVQQLSNTGSDSGSKGASVTQAMTKTQEDKSAGEKLRCNRIVFIKGVTDANLSLLLDELLLKNVINDGEMESVRGERLRSDKAREIIDMVWRKGNGACSEMIDIVCRLDPRLGERLHQPSPPGQSDRPTLDGTTTHNNGFTGAGSTQKPPELTVSEPRVVNISNTIYNTVSASNEPSGVPLPILVNTLAADGVKKKQVKLAAKRLEKKGMLVQAKNNGTASYKVAKGKKSVKKPDAAKKPKAAEESPKRVKKPAAKRPAAKKSAADKPAVKIPAAKKPAADKPAVKKPAAKNKKKVTKTPKKATKKPKAAKKAPAKKKAQPKPRKATSKKK